MAECGAGVRLLQVKYLHSINATFQYYCLIHDHYCPYPNARPEIQCRYIGVLSVTVVSPWTHAMSCVVVSLGQSAVVVKCLEPATGARSLARDQD